MEKIVKRLLTDSIKLRSLSPLSNYSSLQNCANSSQDTLACQDLEKCNKDMKIQNFLSVDNDPKNIIKSIQENYKDMDVKEAIKAMDILRNALRVNKQLSYIDLKDFEGLVHMCKLIHKNVRSLNMYDIIHSLRILLSLNIPPNSVLIQTLLQLIRVSLNDLSVGQMILLYHTLVKLEKLPLIKSLLVALPHAFKQRAPLELDAESNHLSKALKFSCVINDLRTKLYIINILHKNEKSITLENIVDIFYALCTLPEMNSVPRNLLFKIKAKIRINCRFLTVNQIQLLLDCISMKVANKEMLFYSKEIVDELCNAVRKQSNVTFSQNITILKNLNKMRHSNIYLLDHLATKCVEDKNILTQCTISDVDHFMKGFIVADYKPPCWDTIQTMLLNFVVNTDYSIHNAVSVAFRLLSLNCYCPELLEKVFTLYRSKFVKITNEQIIQTTVKLHRCVQLLYPEYNGVMLNEAVLDEISTSYKKEQVPSLRASLNEALAGAEYVMTGLRTKFGEFIDYVVVVQPNGSPMDVKDYNGDIKFVEDFESLTHCSKILFFALPENAYSLNKQNMLSTKQMELKAIEMMKGFYAIAINPYLWKNLSNNEKVSHLRQAMKSKCGILDIISDETRPA